jgi:hypothetical protein
MPGMNSGPSPASSILVAAFRSALLQQALIVALIFVFVLATWAVMRTAIGDQRADAVWPEPRGRQLLRIGFGALWVFDALLQAQPQMAGGMPAQLQAADAGSPGWVVDMVNWGAGIWTYHPVAAAAATVWIQIGIGLWLIFAVRGWSLRLAALSSVAWGLIVWSFGEAFGAILAPGLTVLFGAPGGVIFYVAAGALLMLPQRSWERPALGRLILGGSGVFFLGMALLQAWPGRGFWQGRVDGQPGSLTAMIQSMTGTPQPRALEVIVSGFGNFTGSHGFAVNLVAVLALAAAGAAFCLCAARSDVRLARIAVIGAAVFCLADWVLVEDLGFLGGQGTDPNSMIPLILLFTAGYLGLTPQPAPEEAAAAVAAGPDPARAQRLPRWLAGPALAFAGAPLRVIAGIAALGVILVGAAPMAFATVDKTADPITAETLSGTSGQLDAPAPNFTLTSQYGRPVSAHNDIAFVISAKGEAQQEMRDDPGPTTDATMSSLSPMLADPALQSMGQNQ